MRLITLTLLLLISFTPFAQDYLGGEAIFTQNCVACHKMDEALVGPKLNTVVKLQGEDWTREWIKNNVALRESGDKHAKEVYEAYGKQAMPVYEGMLSDEDLDNLVFYLENWDSKQKELAAEEAAKAPVVPVNAGEIEVKMERSIQFLIILCFAIMVMGFLFMYRSFKLMAKMYFKGRIVETFLLGKLGMGPDEANTELNDWIEEQVEERITLRKKQLKKIFNEKIEELDLEKQEPDWFDKIHDK